MNKILILSLITPLLFSCSNNIINDKSRTFVKNKNNFDFFIKHYSDNIEKLWGFNEKLNIKLKNHIKYTDQYETRSYINLDNKTIIIETLTEEDPILYLRRAIINTILMNNSFNYINDYSSNVSITNINTCPTAYGQIFDNNNKPIYNKSCASNFADYLLKNSMKTRTYNLRQIWSITIQLVFNNINKKAHKYLDVIHEASKRYGIEKSLILAIIQVESNFNPYAISNSDALGLMQVIRHSAGRDVFKMKGKWGQPSKNYLLNPKNNIDTGTAYLAILQNIYLNNIINPISRKYAMIVAYNSGVGNVLKIFSNNQNKAFQIINTMHPDDFYHMLYVYHPSVESRRYLYKVNFLQRHYWR